MSTQKCIQEFLNGEERMLRITYKKAKRRNDAKRMAGALARLGQISNARIALAKQSFGPLALLIEQKIESLDICLAALWAEVIAEGESAAASGNLIMARKAEFGVLLDSVRLKQHAA